MVGKTETATDRPKRKRRWFQYSLGTLLLFVTVSAIPCSWLSVKMRQAERQREAATAIEKLGGKVDWDNKALGWPAWLRKVLGDDFFNSVVFAGLSGTKVTDAGLEHLKGLSQLQWLQFNGTQVTDAGLEHLKGLSQLKWLELNGTQLTDGGLEQLKGLSQLQALVLDNTQVTDAGLEHLKGLSQLQQLQLTDTTVTDAGLEHLKGLSQLQWLYLVGTRVTDEGVRKLQQALPKCHIAH
jgi:Leucine-rich repeat (LRR) protein